MTRAIRGVNCSMLMHCMKNIDSGEKYIISYSGKVVSSNHKLYWYISNLIQTETTHYLVTNERKGNIKPRTGIRYISLDVNDNNKKTV